MSNRAEQAALSAYPSETRKIYQSDFGLLEFDNNKPERMAYLEGYEQAEKDLSLTAEDVKKIAQIAGSLIVNKICPDEMDYYEYIVNWKWSNESEYYEEVIKRFNVYKAKEQ